MMIKKNPLGETHRYGVWKNAHARASQIMLRLKLKPTRIKLVNDDEKLAQNDAKKSHSNWFTDKVY